MNKITKYTYVLGLALVALTTACEDQGSEITEVNYERLFSPLNLEARVTNKTNVRLNWTATKGATSYTIEVFADDNLTFTGTPAKTIEGVTVAELPYTIMGLEGETQYSIRIKAVGEDIEASKWSTATATTDAEQILEAVVEADLTSTSVTLHWPAGETATTITLTPGDITHTVTADEIATGTATIDGLTPEVAYTAKLMNGTKTRGTATFTTLIDLAGAIAINPDDDFASMLESAQDGDAFAFYPGTYMVQGEDGKAGKLNISASIEIKAVRPSDRPVINGCIALNNGASLTMKQIKIDGTNTDGSQAFDFKTATSYQSLILDDCEISNYTKGFFYINVAATIDKISINNCLIHGIQCSGGDFFDSRSGAYKELSLINSTVYNSGASGRDFVRFDDKSSAFPGISPIITITNCTIELDTDTKRIFYVRFKGNSITFKNNLVTNTKAIFSDQVNTAIPTFGNNNYFNTPGLFTGGSTSAKFFDDNATKLDPDYADATKGDFTVSNEDIIFYKIGDPRWIK